jgi:hypothetical protein
MRAAGSDRDRRAHQGGRVAGVRVVADQQRPDLAELLPAIASRPGLVDDLLPQSIVEHQRLGGERGLERIAQVRRGGAHVRGHPIDE